ncbi:MAG: acyl-CoA dehydrogenase family protein, partial [Proteobacteria bacterium]|nr:acyl-CoA dehydrogenase family protein [Pseudomonadota bacterium]
MAYDLTEEQKMIRAMVRDFARAEILPTASERDKTNAFPTDILLKMGELGLMGMNVPP